MGLLGWFFPTSKTIAKTEGLEFPLSYNVPYVPSPPSLAKPKPKQKEKNTSGYSGPCQCVSYARYKTGFSDSFGPKGQEGYAKYWPNNSDIPIVGGVVITGESGAGHVAYIADIQGQTIYTEEWHYGGCFLTKRTLNINSPLIKGYWRP